MEARVEPTKNEKFNLLNEKLSAMMASKKDKILSKQSTVVTSAPETSAVEVQKPKQVPTELESNQKDDKSEKDEKNENEPKKIKKIKKMQPEKKQTLRKAAGYVWEDKTMEDWDEKDHRVFCGNLGNEVSDEILARVFRKYPSFQKAKVVRDKRTGKTRGYGFVSFKNPKDFLACLSEMEGQYVGNRPVRLKKSSWKDRTLESEQNQLLPSDFRKHSKKKTSSINTNFVFTGAL